jgi:hypothetical protein
MSAQKFLLKGNGADGWELTWVMGCLCGGARSTTGVLQVPADLLHYQSPQPWANTNKSKRRGLNLERFAQEERCPGNSLFGNGPVGSWEYGFNHELQALFAP